MTASDRVMQQLGTLEGSEPCANVSRQIRSAAHARLRARSVHPLWTWAVLASVVVYLGWALRFASSLY